MNLRELVEQGRLARKSIASEREWEDQYINDPWRNPMKPGPYKSSTHGDIPLSVRGRELLQKLRDATAKVAASGDTDIGTACGRTLAHCRGELAKYMSHMEQIIDSQLTGVPRSLFCDGGGATGDNGGKRGKTFSNQETNVNEPKKDPIRSQQLHRASQEVVDATGVLEKLREFLASGGIEAPLANARLYGEFPAVVNCQSIMFDAVGKLIAGQWPTLRDEAVYRAEVRVWEAEAALARLLGSEPTAPKPRKPRAPK